MYLVNSGLFKSPELTIDHLKVENLKKNFDWGGGAPRGATININIVLPQDDPTNKQY
jgi:hypothetical protein